ncbi:hypothetical protein [Pseudomonas sp. ANT_J28]|uniref:hypothetical protein n=1 Tax=Pseudomonas sp. ANT_J28 TaxID=2597352 RepID=UPI0011F2A9FA|nr:hypothetical protein [Pseudomonas sp. ANT_J28]KAA0977253.1 hypothetical protein FQ187_26915 [Pseudomonas sp. ANT_J28]
MNIKKWLLNTCVCMWQFLRIVCGVVLLGAFLYFIYLMVVSPRGSEGLEEKAAQPICGRLSGKTLVVPRSYVVFWAEYEGESAWDKNTFHENTGCDANFISLPMVVTWPSFQSVDHSKYFRDGLGFDGLEVVVTPMFHNEFYLRARRDAFLGNATGQQVEGASYIDGLGLYLVKRRDNTFPEILNEYYWREEEGEVQAVFECLGNHKDVGVYSCRGEFLLGQLDALIKIGFTPEKLSDWKSIAVLTKEFVLSKVAN